MLVNDAGLKTILPLRGSSRQISPFHVFAWASFSVWNVFPASLGQSYSPISQGQSLAPLLHPSGNPPGGLRAPAYPGNAFSREGNSFAQDHHLQKIAARRPDSNPVFLETPLLSTSWAPPELPCAPWTAVPCLLQAVVPTLSLSLMLRFPSAKKKGFSLTEMTLFLRP